jgi:hypothetical protein
MNEREERMGSTDDPSVLARQSTHGLDELDVASEFLEQLAALSRSDALDGPWYAALGTLVERGWRVTAPEGYHDG